MGQVFSSTGQDKRDQGASEPMLLVFYLHHFLYVMIIENSNIQGSRYLKLAFWFSRSNDIVQIQGKFMFPRKNMGTLSKSKFH